MLSAALRLWDLSTLPPGLTPYEIDDLLLTETARQGNPRILYNVRGDGREGIYPMLLTATTTITGGGLIGYRIVSVFAGMITLAMVYALGKRLFGSPAGLTAMALLGVGLFPILLSRTIGNDSLIPLYVTAVLLALSQALPVYGRLRQPRTTSFAALGVILGLGFYIHPISLIVTLAVMIFILVMVFGRRDTSQPRLSRRSLSYTWFTVVVMIVLATPYLIATLGSPELSGARRLFGSEATPGELSSIESIILGLNGILFRGDHNPIHNLPARPLLDLVSGLLLLIGLVTAIRYFRQPRFALLVMLLLFVLPIALLAPDSPNFIAFASALPLLALLFGLGVTTLYRSFPPRTKFVANLMIAALVMFNVQWTVRDLFFAWRADAGVQVAYNSRLNALAHYLDVNAGSNETIVCQAAAGDSATATDSTQTLLLMMHRQTAPLRYADCGAGLIFADGGTESHIVAPDPRTFATVNPFLARWYQAGDVLDRADMPPDGVVILEVESELADTIGRFTTTAPVSFAPEAGGGDDVIAPPIRMGGNISFLGYEPTTDQPFAPGDIVPIVTYWRVDGDVPSDLRLFVHILSDPAAIAVQWDSISVQPSQLQARDVFVQVTFMQLPYTIREGVYGISVGAYEGSTANRLPVYDVADQERGSRLFMGQLVVEIGIDSASDAQNGGG